jgi:small subunit ribosomal protein S6
LREELRRVRQYELMTIFSPDVPEDDLQGAIQRVGDIISTAGGTVTLINRESPWGRRRLSYPIRHGGRDVRDGFYVLYYVDLDTQNVAEIERDLKLMDSVMRYLVTQQLAEPMIPESERVAAEEAAAGADAASAEAAADSTGEAEVARADAAEAEVVPAGAAEAEQTTPDAAEAEETTQEVGPTDSAAAAEATTSSDTSESTTSGDATDDSASSEATDDTAAVSGDDTGNES